MTTAVLRPPAPTGPLSPTPDSPSPARPSSGGAAGDEPAAPARDPVFWTELEIRRLGNLIAASIEARAFVGASAEACAERAQMRVFLDAMKRKAFRVLERAEQFAHSPQHEWPGLDPTVADPVALADEYVKVVQDYLAVLAAEEDAAATAAADAAEEADAAADAAAPDTADAGAGADAGEGEDEGGADAGEAGGDGSGDAQKAAAGASDDWVEKDDEAYREALEREREALEKGKGERGERESLLEEDGLRRRKGGDGADAGADSGQGRLSAADEELMARHQPVQDDLTANLVDLVGQLKDSVADNRDKLKSDADVLDTADSAVDASLAAIKRQRENLSNFTQATSTSWWLILAGAGLVVVVFLFVFILLKVPM